MDKQFNFSMILGVVITLVSVLIAKAAGWGYEFHWLEFLAVATSYSCTYLCVVQLRSNYLIGVVTTLLYSILFYQWQLPALALFNLYLVLSLAYGWFRWGKDEETLPVTNIGFDKWLLGYGALAFGIYMSLLGVNSYFDYHMQYMDIIATILSGVAQFMLDNKKRQNWIVWAIVNVISIVLFYKSGLYLAMIQYIVFLANTAWGWIEWTKTMEANNV